MFKILQTRCFFQQAFAHGGPAWGKTEPATFRLARPTPGDLNPSQVRPPVELAGTPTKKNCAGLWLSRGPSQNTALEISQQNQDPARSTIAGIPRPRARFSPCPKFGRATVANTAVSIASRTGWSSPACSTSRFASPVGAESSISPSPAPIPGLENPALCTAAYVAIARLCSTCPPRATGQGSKARARGSGGRAPRVLPPAFSAGVLLVSPNKCVLSRTAGGGSLCLRKCSQPLQFPKNGPGGPRPKNVASESRPGAPSPQGPFVAAQGGIFGPVWRAAGSPRCLLLPVGITKNN